MNDVMLDLETYGNHGGCIILSIGAVFFNHAGLGEEFYRVINIENSKECGLREDEDTVKWWAQQSPEARTVITQATDGGLLLREALLAFNTFLGPMASKIRLWGNGSDFDNVILLEAYRAADLTPPWKFYNHRCHRTLKNVGVAATPARIGTHHNALDDAKTQAVHAIALLKNVGFYK